MIKRFLVVAFTFSSTISAAQAELLTEKNIPSDLAVQMASDAVQACAADKYSVSAAVVDRAGVLRALVRADNAGPHTVDSSRAKAFTSASLRIPTSKLAENAANNPGSAQVVSIPGFLVLGGGMPIKAGG